MSDNTHTVGTDPNQCRTIQEAAGLLRVSVDHVRNLIDAGELASVDLSSSDSDRRCRRILQHQIDAFICSRTATKPHPGTKSPSTMAQLPPVTKWV